MSDDDLDAPGEPTSYETELENKYENLEQLFVRYIRHVRACEGVDYILSGEHYHKDSFTQEEWEILEELAKEPDFRP